MNNNAGSAFLKDLVLRLNPLLHEEEVSQEKIELTMKGFDRALQGADPSLVEEMVCYAAQMAITIQIKEKALAKAGLPTDLYPVVNIMLQRFFYECYRTLEKADGVINDVVEKITEPNAGSN